MGKKRKKTFSFILYSFSVCFVLFLLILVLGIEPVGKKYTDSLLNTITSRQGDLKIFVQNLNRGFLNRLSLEKTIVTYKEETLFTADEIDLSFGVFDILRYMSTGKLPLIRIFMESPELNINQDVVNLFSNDNKESSSNTNNSNSNNDLLSKIINQGFLLVVNNADIVYEAGGYRIEIDDFYTALSMERNFKFSELSYSISKASLVVLKTGLCAQLNNFKFFLDDKNNLLLNADSVSLGEYGKFLNFEGDFILNENNTFNGHIKIGDSLVKYGNNSLTSDKIVLYTAGDPSKGKYNIRAESEDANVSTDYGTFKIKGIDCNYNPSEKSTLVIKSIESALLPENNYAEFEMSDFDNISGRVNFGFSATLKINFAPKSRNLNLFVNLNSLKTKKYKNAINAFVPIFSNYISDETVINGSMSFEGTHPNANLLLDLSGQHLKFGSRIFDTQLGLSSTLDGYKANIEDFSLNAFGKTLSYKGLFDIKNLIPQGNLILSDTETQNYLAFLVVEHDSKLNEYTFRCEAPAYSSMVINGNVGNLSNNILFANALIETKLYSYPISITFNPNSLNFSVKSSGVDIVSHLVDDRYLKISGQLDDMFIKVSEKVDISADCNINGQFDLERNDFNLNFDKFYVRVSDILNFGFDLNVGKFKSVLTNLRVGASENDVYFDGSAGIENFSLRDLLSGASHNLNAYVDLKRVSTDQYIKFYYFNKTYVTDIYLLIPTLVKLSGNGNLRSNSFFRTTLGRFSFDAVLSDKKLTFDNFSGQLSTVEINDFNFVIDFVSRSLNGSFKLENTLHNESGDVYQHALFDISAKLDSIRATALNLAGLEAMAEFNVNMRDAYLGGKYAIVDNSFKLVVTQNGLSVDGELVKGKYVFKSKEVEFYLSRLSNLGCNIKGNLGKNINLMINDIYINSPLVNLFINYPNISIESGIFTGDLLLKENSGDVSFFGMIFSNDAKVNLFWVPDQVLSLKSPAFTFVDHTIYMPSTKVYGYSSLHKRDFTADLSFELNFGKGNCVENMNLHLIATEKPVDVEILLLGQNSDMAMRGDVLGIVDFDLASDGLMDISGDITCNNFNFFFKIDKSKYPSWAFGRDVKGTGVNLNITTGKNACLIYPDEDNPFLSFTFNEGERFNLVFNRHTNRLSGKGELSVKTGRISYFSNDFFVTDGLVRVNNNIETGALMFDFDAKAKIKQYDSNGNPQEIYVVFNHATVDNLTPRIESSSQLTQNEILQIMGSNVIESSNGINTAGTIASIVAKTTDVLSVLGITNSTSSRFSLNTNVKNAFKLDAFSVRSPIIENLFIDSLPSHSANDSSLLSRYLNGTSIFVGKYIGNNLFLHGNVGLASTSRGSSNDKFGHFMTEDLNLDLELSVDWDIPFGTVSFFTQPTELSVFDFLYNIGFSLTKRISF